MSTKMAETERAVALQVFRAALPRRGAKGRYDQLVRDALHYFSVHNITWRALPERFGKWNSVWKRFDRLSEAGVFEAFFDHLASLSSSAHLAQMFDSRESQRGSGPWPQTRIAPQPCESFECVSAIEKHAPGTGPGKRVPGAGTRTASRTARQEGEAHRAFHGASWHLQSSS